MLLSPVDQYVKPLDEHRVVNVVMKNGDLWRLHGDYPISMILKASS